MDEKEGSKSHSDHPNHAKKRGLTSPKYETLGGTTILIVVIMLNEGYLPASTLTQQECTSTQKFPQLFNYS